MRKGRTCKGNSPNEFEIPEFGKTWVCTKCRFEISKRFIDESEWMIHHNKQLNVLCRVCLLRLSIFRFFCPAVCCFALGSARFAIKTSFCNSSAFATRGEILLRQERQQRHCHMIAWYRRWMIFCRVSSIFSFCQPYVSSHTNCTCMYFLSTSVN